MSEWQQFFRFSTDALERNKWSYKIRSCTATTTDGSGPVNLSQVHTENWLRSEFIPAIAQTRSPFVAFAIGEPGSGKSTFFKFLVNVYRDEINKRRVVVSRFEALKFRRRCFGVRSSHDLEKPLTEYLSLILLRDLLLSVAYEQNSSGVFSRLPHGTFASNESIDHLLEEVQTGPTKSRGDLIDGRYDAFAGLVSALQPSWVSQRALDRVPHLYRQRILELYAAEWTFCVIFDGLDHFSVEDNVFDPGNFGILRLLVNSFALLGGGSLVHKVSFAVPFHSIFVLRRSTHTKLMDLVDLEQQLPPIRTFEIAPIKPEVIMSNAIDLGLARAANPGYSRAPRLIKVHDAAFRDRIHVAVDMALRYIDISLDLDRQKYGILRIFNGNIRAAFTYLGRVLDWILLEGQNAGQIRLGTASIEEFLDFLGRDAQGIMRRRKYRLVHLLLYYGVPMFKNAVFNLDDTDVGDTIMFEDAREKPWSEQKATGGQLRANAAYTGFVDNVFNYHISERVPDHGEHRLLQKLRILQICPTDEWMRAEDLKTELQRQFGYNLADNIEMRDLLLVLLRSGFIKIDGQNRKAFVQRTDKGTIVLNTLMSRMTYLEHVFHQTLFPKVLVEQVRDLTRDDDENQWILSSIRNCFIFLAYINFVENYPANGVVVEPSSRITLNVSLSLAEAVGRIMTDAYRRRPHTGSVDWLVNRALNEIEDTLNTWYRLGLLQPIETSKR